MQTSRVIALLASTLLIALTWSSPLVSQDKKEQPKPGAVPDKRLAESKNEELAAELLRLRKAAIAWLKRDLRPDELAPSQAYADLIFAFGLARLGQKDEAQKLLREATAALPDKDVIHRCLLQAFTYRIDEALAGRAHTGPFRLRYSLVFPRKLKRPRTRWFDTRWIACGHGPESWSRKNA
jgi:hypothetical protein